MDILYKNLGRLIAIFDHTTNQVKSNQVLNPLFVLYQMEISPYCKKVLKFMASSKWGIEVRDVLESDADYQDLMSGGKVDMVPCLRIRSHSKSLPAEDTWIYESIEIINFLKSQNSN